MNIINPPPIPAAPGFMPPVPRPYPLSAFHLIESNAASEVLNNEKGLDAMIGVSFLKAMSLSCMGLISVQFPMGQVRALKDKINRARSPDQSVDAFNDQLKAAMVNEPVILHVSKKADAVLKQAGAVIRTRAAEGDMRPYLLRLHDHMVCITGVFHRFEGCEGEISGATARIAVEFGFWLADVYPEVVSRPLKSSVAEKNDIQMLAMMLSLFVHLRRRIILTKREIYGMARSFGLGEPHCKRALHHLCSLGLACLETYGNSTTIRLTSKLFSM